MAYAALTSLAGVIDQILPHDQKYVSLCDKDKMKSLHEKVSLLQEFLEYVSSRPPLPAIDALESRIRNTAHRMEDTIELVILTEPSESNDYFSCFKSYVQPFLFCLRFKNGDVGLEFSCYFKEVHVLVEQAMEMKKIADNNAIPGKHTLTTTTLSKEALSSKGTKMGLEKALNQILDQINRKGPMLRIVSITGMGGIGKTTLAKASYEDPRTVRHFDVRLWVTVSQDYNIKEILQGLLPESKQDGERLIEYVHKHLKGRRYLIILDDMWDGKVWDRVRNAFPDDNKGSRVILTTRSSGVASYVGSSSHIHEMQFLNEDQSWDLLRVNVYGHEWCSPEFEDIGRRIARNCKGLPLAVVVTAGLLKFNKTRDYWKGVARNINEAVTTSNDNIFEILSWSYTRLPPHLKACFLYLGAYKEDYEIPTKELVRLWASEGFLKPKQSRSIEVVAEECLEQLVERSLVLVTKRRYNGKIKTCSVHDVLREVSIRKAEEEKFHHHFNPSTFDESTFRNVLAVQRRVSITNCYVDNFQLDTFFVNAHSLLDQCYNGYGNMSVIQYLKLLRVLSMAEIQEDSQFSILCTLTNLRYLHFDWKGKNTSIMIPKSISELQNLETLIASARWGTIRLVFPLEIWKLQHLRHIVVKGGSGNFKSDVQVLGPNQSCPSLQTLSRPRNITFTKSFAERIPNLRKLKLKVEYNRDADQVYGMDGLQYLHQLEKLNIHFDFPDYYARPANFVFPQNLTNLSLCGTAIPWEDLSPIGLLPKLKVLKLKRGAVDGYIWEPIEGEFLQLEHLKLEDLYIGHWRAENMHFPCLRKLVILNCDYLEEVPESIGEINTLETLIVRLNKVEAIRSVEKIQKNQRDMGNDLLHFIFLDRGPLPTYWQREQEQGFHLLMLTQNIELFRSNDHNEIV